MTWTDISQTLEPGMAVWPGDAAFTWHHAMRLDEGDPFNLAGITLSLHCGTHADAPRHFDRHGPTIAECDLDAFVGPALVLDVSGQRPVLAASLAHLESGRCERVLFKTGTGVEGGWHDDFSYLEQGTAEALVRLGVKLAGLDTPSVDAARSTTWPAHRILAAAGVVVLENLRLDGVEAGRYELVAVPLKFRDLEASPVRALLRRLPASGLTHANG